MKADPFVWAVSTLVAVVGLGTACVALNLPTWAFPFGYGMFVAGKLTGLYCGRKK